MDTVLPGQEAEDYKNVHGVTALPHNHSTCLTFPPDSSVNLA